MGAKDDSNEVQSKSKAVTRSRRPRLVDVARLAGVSLGSASRALSAPELVKPKTREAVRLAAEHLSYVVDGAARSLALRRSLSVGAILPTINNPIFADFVQALQRRLSEDNYSLFVSAHEYSRDAESLIVERLLQRSVDGLVLIGTDQDQKAMSQIARAEVPHIFAWSSEEKSRVSVGFSNRRAMQQVTQHLIQLGHRRIALLSGHTEYNERARARLDGVLDTTSLAGLDVPTTIFSEFSVDAGRRGLREAMARTPRPTALICSTDLMAAGALSEAAIMGIKVPEELSITGFDNIEFSALLTPQLTTVDVPTAEIGKAAGDAIIAAMAGDSIERAPFPTQLVARGSTGPAPG